MLFFKITSILICSAYLAAGLAEVIIPDGEAHLANLLFVIIAAVLLGRVWVAARDGWLVLIASWAAFSALVATLFVAALIMLDVSVASARILALAMENVGYLPRSADGWFPLIALVWALSVLFLIGVGALAATAIQRVTTFRQRER